MLEHSLRTCYEAKPVKIGFTPGFRRERTGTETHLSEAEELLNEASRELRAAPDDPFQRRRGIRSLAELYAVVFRSGDLLPQNGAVYGGGVRRQSEPFRGVLLGRRFLAEEGFRGDGGGGMEGKLMTEG